MGVRAIIASSKWLSNKANQPVLLSPGILLRALSTSSSASRLLVIEIFTSLFSLLAVSSNAAAVEQENCIKDVVIIEVTECQDIPTYPNLPRLEINGINVTSFIERFREPLMVRRCFTRQQQELRCVPDPKPKDQ